MSFGVEEASIALKRGELVIVPTETVYGLAADASSVPALNRVFAAKERPPNNPLILHVASAEQATKLVRTWPDQAEVLASYFWPGPLTLVLSKDPRVPDVATAGMDTVAVRMPDHPLAKSLIEAFGGPIAAPSANRFTRLSPTRVEDLDPLIVQCAAGVLDGGPCAIGIESTVLDLTGKPTILRYGGIGRSEIERLLGEPVSDVSDRTGRSPGEHPKHYAPNARVVLVENAADSAFALVFGPARGPNHISMPDNPAGYAKNLYGALAHLDRLSPLVIQIERPATEQDWAAVWDRLKRCSHSCQRPTI